MTIAPKLKLPNTLKSKTTRIVLLAALIDWIGTGMLVVSAPIYLVSILDIDANSVGMALSLAGATGVFASIFISRIADSTSPKIVLCVLCLWRAFWFVAYAMYVEDFTSFLFVIVMIYAADLSAGPLISTIATTICGKEGRFEFLSFYRAIVNVGMSTGALSAAVVIGNWPTIGFQILLLVNGLSFLIAGVILWRAKINENPVVEKVTLRTIFKSPRNQKVGRRVYGLAALDGIFLLYLSVLNVAMPIWIAQKTEIDPAINGYLYAFNTFMCIVFPYYVQSKVPSLRISSTCLYIATFAQVVACGLFAWSGNIQATALTVVCLIAAILVLTLGELLHAPASARVSYAIANKEALTRSFAVFGFGRAGMQIVGPILMTALVVSNGPIGWAYLAGLFALAGIVMARTTFLLGCEEEKVLKV